MSYKDTFVQVATDCPVSRGVVPPVRGESKSVAVIQHELLSAHPYRFGHEDLIFEVHVRHKNIPTDELNARGAAIRAELFRKPHPCMRASPLAKTYGWGVHYDKDGRIAIYAMESDAYRSFTSQSSAGPKLVAAMRSAPAG